MFIFRMFECIMVSGVESTVILVMKKFRGAGWKNVIMSYLNKENSNRECDSFSEKSYKF